MCVLVEGSVHVCGVCVGGDMWVVYMCVGSVYCGVWVHGLCMFVSLLNV